MTLEKKTMSFRRLTKNNSTNQVKVSLTVLLAHLFYTGCIWIIAGDTCNELPTKEMWRIKPTGKICWLWQDCMIPKHFPRDCTKGSTSTMDKTRVIHSHTEAQMSTTFTAEWTISKHTIINLKLVFYIFSTHSFHSLFLSLSPSLSPYFSIGTPSIQALKSRISISLKWTVLSENSPAMVEMCTVSNYQEIYLLFIRSASLPSL